MKLLLDTHILLWGLYTPARLSAAETAALNTADWDTFYSPVSVFEAEQKRILGKWDIAPASKWVPILERNGLKSVAITDAIMETAANLPLVHKDPWDRILIAQAILNDMTLMTRDSMFLQYEVSVLS